MICDAVESGVRSIKNPNEERVREFVDKIVFERAAADRQFDESDLRSRISTSSARSSRADSPACTRAGAEALPFAS